MNKADQAKESAINITRLCKTGLRSQFPGFDELGLNPDVPKEKAIGDSIVYAVAAAKDYPEFGDSSSPFVRLETMLHYDVISENEVIFHINQVSDSIK